MTSPQRPHESQSDRTEESDRSPTERSPMERFRSLTRSLLGVTPEQMREQDRKNRERQTNKIVPFSQ
jgi:hypothetical protein